LEGPGVDGRIILKRISEKWDGTDWIALAQDRDRWRGSCKCGNKPSGSIKYVEFLE
jgi:hypothetical protein